MAPAKIIDFDEITTRTTHYPKGKKLSKRERRRQRKQAKAAQARQAAEAARAPLDEPNSRAMCEGLPPRRAEFLRMIATCRPDGSDSEAAFIERYIEPLGQLAHVTDYQRDYHGNYFLTVPDAHLPGKPSVAFTSHLDTVHSRGGWQSLNFDPSTGIIRLADNSSSNCLGADCTAGVWLMRHMILAARPGLYCFYRAEERGCLGSEWSAKNDAQRYAGIDAMISLDRRGFDEVITHQCGLRTASEAFAWSLAKELNGTSGTPGGYKPSDDGIYTDSREFTDLIPECTNISVGYFDQHTSRERQHLLHLDYLLRRLIALDVTRLAIVRKAGEHEYGIGGGPYYAAPGRYAASTYWADYASEENLTVTETDREHWGKDYGDYRDRADLYDAAYSVKTTGSTTLANLTTMVANNPEIAAQLLYETGIGVADFAEYIFERTGHVPQEAC